MKLALSALGLLVSTITLAGTISGGGGMVTKYHGNPWFLENTSNVNYCIHVAPAFGVPEARLDQLIQGSIRKWQDAFAYARDDYYEQGKLAPYGQVRVATQRFVPNCSSPDIDFMFGMLTEEQKGHFEKVTDYVAAAVRTAYDLEKLSSKGFVYVAPLDGDLKPDTQSIDPEAWLLANNFALEKVLLHELGHVFGIDHHVAGDMSRDTVTMSVMWEEFPEFLITKEVADAIRTKGTGFIHDRDPINLVNPRTRNEYKGCGDDALTIMSLERHRTLLGLSPDAQCTRLIFGDREITFFETTSSDGEWREVGKMQPNVYARRNDSFIKVNLPPQQKVFTKLPEMGSGLFYPLFGETLDVRLEYKGKYVTASGDTTMGLDVIVESGNQIRSTYTTSDLQIREDVIRN